MATFYVDPIGGSDAGAGTSFATRWQSLTSGATAARIAAGDTIRVIASPDATDMGQTATWTSINATLTTAVTANIYTSGAWTAASANVTLTTSTTRKLGASSVSISPTATFTTGKAAYLTLASTDFSAYQQVSFWIYMTAGSMTANNDISIRLCSDTTGDVTVNTINIPRILTTSYWQAYTIDTAAALGSAIQSVALYIEVDRGAQTFLISNIMACKASSAADSLSLTSIIGRNNTDDPWYVIQSIDGTIITLDGNQTNVPVLTTTHTINPYTGSYTVFKREPLQLPSTFVNTTNTGAVWGAINDSGSSASPITYSGGWNRTDMSTQTGETYISGINATGNALSFTGAINYNIISKINSVRFGYGIYMVNPNSNNNTIDIRDMIGCRTAGMLVNGYNHSITVKNVIVSLITLTPATVVANCSININNFFGYAIITVGGTVGAYSSNYLGINKIYGNGGTGSNNTFLTLTSAQNSVFMFKNVDQIQCNSTIINNSGSNGNKIYLHDNFNVGISTTNGSFFELYGTNNFIYFINCVPTRDTRTNVLVTTIAGSQGIIENYIYNATNIGSITLNGSTQTNITLVNSPYVAPTLTAAPYFYKLTYANVSGSTADQRMYFPANFGTILTDATVRHSLTGISWKMTVGSVNTTTSPNIGIPLCLPVAKIACNASALVTASIWVYRTSTSLVTNFVCQGGQITGVSTTTATAAAAINTWEQLTITFTPTQQGVVELEVNCYGAVASVYVDDFSVSQA